MKPPFVAVVAADGVTKTGSDKGVNPSFEAFVCAVTKANIKLPAASRNLEPTTLQTKGIRESSHPIRADRRCLCTETDAGRLDLQEPAIARNPIHQTAVVSKF